MSEARDYKVIGTRVIRPDGVDKVTGRANFGADFSLPGMLYGKVLRSPHAHARIKNDRHDGRRGDRRRLCDRHRRRLPEGRHEEITGGEGAGDFADLATNVMARDKVVYHGHAVAAVAAKSSAIADAALAAIKVEYEVLTPVMDLDAAMADGAPLVDEDLFTAGLPQKPTKPSNVAAYMEFKRGDIAKGFAEADVVVEGTYRTPTVHQGYIEPHACVASINQGGQATIWCCTQGHFDVRSMTSKVLGMNVADIRVIPSEIGGGFGGKTTVYLEPVAMVLSKKSGRPVKMTMTRDEVFRASGPASATKCTIKIGAKKDGTFTAMSAWLAYEAGGYKGSSMAPGAMCVFAPYNVAALPDSGLRRAGQQTQGRSVSRAGRAAVDVRVRESDRRSGAAAEDGSDRSAPQECRQRRAARRRTGRSSTRSASKQCLEAAKKHPNYAVKLGPNEGRGLAAGFWFNAGMQSSAEVHINENGTVTIVEGSPDIGGSRASMALMAAEELGVPYERVRVLVADTESAGYNNTTGGSRVTFATGMAVIQASRDIIAQCKQRAAATWGIEADLVDWQDGQAIPKPGVNADVKPLTPRADRGECRAHRWSVARSRIAERARPRPGLLDQHG